jgi:hypothetical protein
MSEASTFHLISGIKTGNRPDGHIIFFVIARERPVLPERRRETKGATEAISLNLSEIASPRYAGLAKTTFVLSLLPNIFTENKNHFIQPNFSAK